MKKILIVGNWKMNLLQKEAQDLLRELSCYILPQNIQAGVCPPSLWISSAVKQLQGTSWLVAAQNVHSQDHGAYTGEISAPMLFSSGCQACLVGHSERRQIFLEQDEQVAAKAVALLSNGITPILCVGETLEERQSGEAENVVRRQVRAVLQKIPAQTKAFPIAYEPVWAIGTGVHCDPETARKMIEQIRQEIAIYFGREQAAITPLLYGGSVKADNIASYLLGGVINGALVGGASLKAKDFIAIFEQARSVEYEQNS